MKSSLLFIFLLLLFNGHLQANPGNNSTLNPNLNSSTNTSILNSSDRFGKSIIIWEEKSSIEKTTPQIFAQRIDANGETLWGKSVELSVDTTRIQNSHKIISDEKGGVIITWEERSIENDETAIYAQHLDSLGNKLWGPAGLLISSAAGSQISPMLTSDGFGGAIIVWTDSRNDPTYSNWDIYAQRLSADGHFMWEIDGLLISADIKDEYLAKVLPAANGGITIIWNKVTTDFSGTAEGYEFHFRKLDGDGNQIRLMNAENFLTLPVGNVNYVLGGDILSDGNEGFFLSLAMNNELTNSSLFLQHVSSTGDLAYSGNYGLLIDNSIDDNKNINLETDSAGNVLVKWLRKDSASTITYSQKFDRSGNRIPLDIYLDDLGEVQLVYNLIDTLSITEPDEGINNITALQGKLNGAETKSEHRQAWQSNRDSAIRVNKKVIAQQPPSNELAERVSDSQVLNKIRLVKSLDINQCNKLFGFALLDQGWKFSTAHYTDNLKRDPDIYFTVLATENPHVKKIQTANKNSKAVVSSLYSLASSG